MGIKTVIKTKNFVESGRRKIYYNKRSKSFLEMGKEKSKNTKKSNNQYYKRFYNIYGGSTEESRAKNEKRGKKSTPPSTLQSKVRLKADLNEF